MIPPDVGLYGSETIITLYDCSMAIVLPMKEDVQNAYNLAKLNI